jgi:hypothetical protein
LTEAEAEAMVSHGKLTTQAKNCMGCHTLLGNGAYFAPDLTKAWLDPAWGSKDAREQAMVDFLMHPELAAHNALGRRMPNLGITEDEARATVAFLKWMSSIDTNASRPTSSRSIRLTPLPLRRRWLNPPPIWPQAPMSVPRRLNNKEFQHGSSRHAHQRQP